MEPIQKLLDREVIRMAALGRRMCAEAGVRWLDPGAWVSALLRYEPNSALLFLTRVGIDVKSLKNADRANFDASAGTIPAGAYFSVRLHESCRSMLRAADEYRRRYDQPLITLPHVLVAALKVEPVLQVFFEHRGAKFAALEQALGGLPAPKPPAPNAGDGPLAAADGCEQTGATQGDPLQRFCINLTARAVVGRLDAVIGREREIERVVAILRRRRKNNPLLVGPPGAGKTAIVEGLAQAIVAGKVPSQLAKKEIYAVDLAAIVAGTQYRGQFEERFEALLAAARARSQCILFIDEAHMIVGAGSASGTTMDAGNMLKPALARGEICCIAATTDAEHRRYLCGDKALERRFQLVPVREPSADETTHILRGLRPVLEEHHCCKISDAAISAAVELSERHVTDRFFPDKALDALDESCARLNTKQKTVGRKEVELAIAAQIGTPIETVQPQNSDRAALVEAELSRLVIGQERAVAAVTRAVQRAFSPLRDPRRPLACLAFVGPSSTGKTHVAQVLSRCLYGEAPLIQINLAEYVEAHSVSRLFGAPPGYVGHGQGSQLADHLRRHPNAVVLLDNADKAHPYVITALMEAIDTGQVTDAQGDVADLRRAFVILTTVAGCLEPVRRNLGFAVHSDRDHTERATVGGAAACRKVFGEEFINRFDEIVWFAPLGSAGRRQVAELAVAEINERLAAGGQQVRLEHEVLDHLAATSTNARQVRAMIRSEIEPLLCVALASNRRPVITVMLCEGRYAIKEGKLHDERIH